MPEPHIQLELCSRHTSTYHRSQLGLLHGAPCGTFFCELKIFFADSRPTRHARFYLSESAPTRVGPDEVGDASRDRPGEELAGMLLVV